MKNRTLSQDYLQRCHHRLAAIETLFECKSWPDVVRECQEVVELALKGLLRHCGIEVPRIHDVSSLLMDNKSSIPSLLHKDLESFCEISRTMRRDRELAFYGSEDLTPLEFYKKQDAQKAKEQAAFVVQRVSVSVLGTTK